MDEPKFSVPMAYQHYKAGHDGSGNPRRCWVVYGGEGNILDVIDEGYGSKPQWLRSLPELPEVNCTVKDYRELLEWAPK